MRETWCNTNGAWALGCQGIFLFKSKTWHIMERDYQHSYNVDIGQSPQTTLNVLFLVPPIMQLPIQSPPQPPAAQESPQSSP